MPQRQKYFTRYLSLAMVLFTATGQAADAIQNAKNATAVEEVLSGKRTAANAAWWGFNTEDCTEAIQGALDSGAKQVTIPYMGEPWIVRPLQFRSDQVVRFEPGVVILAKQGEFLGRSDPLTTAIGVKNLHDKAPDISIRFGNCIARKMLTEGKPVGASLG